MYLLNIFGTSGCKKANWTSRQTQPGKTPNPKHVAYHSRQAQTGVGRSTPTRSGGHVQGSTARPAKTQRCVSTGPSAQQHPHD